MSENNITDLNSLHEAMILAIKTAIPELHEVAAYKPNGQEIDSPAVLLEVEEMGPGTKTTDGKLAVQIEFNAHCILSNETDCVDREIRNVALSVMQAIDGNRWGLKGCVSLPEQISAFPGAFKNDKKGFESWVVNWRQTVQIGPGWQAPDYLPEDATVRYSPDQQGG